MKLNGKSTEFCIDTGAEAVFYLEIWFGGGGGGGKTREAREGVCEGGKGVRLSIKTALRCIIMLSLAIEDPVI